MFVRPFEPLPYIPAFGAGVLRITGPGSKITGPGSTTGGVKGGTVPVAGKGIP